LLIASAATRSRPTVAIAQAITSREASSKSPADCSTQPSRDKLHFIGDSEGRIVRGLLAVLLTAIEGKSAAQLLARDPLALFDELGLRAQLSASRSQGLNALSEAVLEAARQA
jgi:sulfur transfer protein SufE